MLDQLQTPTKHVEPDKAAKGLRDWERWHRRASDVGVSPPDPTVLLRALSSIMAGVLESYPEAAFRTSLIRNNLKLDTNPTEQAVLSFHRHLLAEAEALATGSKARTSGSSTTTSDSGRISTDKGPKVRGLQTQAGLEGAPSAKTKAPPPPPPASSSTTTPKVCKWFAKSEAGCRRGVDCQFVHEWGQVPKAGRCLVCSSQAHMKKDCPVKEKGASTRQPRPKAEAGQSSTAPGSTNKAMRATEEQQNPTSPQQPAAEPSPSTSPTARTSTVPEGEKPDDLRQIIQDASKMLKTMMASTAGAQPSSSSTSSSTIPTYESIQKQLDELKFRAMKVEKQNTADEEEKGVLLDSGSTHVLRPAHHEEERKECQEVYVTLAGDEKRCLHQTSAGSILVEEKAQALAQTILPFGKVIECLGCTLKWTRGGIHLHHPRHGKIKIRIKSGCPEITDAAQAAALITELEMKQVEELKRKTEQLNHKLNAVKMMEVRDADWRVLLARYTEEGKMVDGLQSLYQSPVFHNLPDAMRMAMVPEMDLSGRAGWELLKRLPLPRRMRKRLFKSTTWILNMFGGGSKKNDPVQTLSGSASSHCSGEVVVINVDALMDAGWNLRGDAYNALLWGAMTARVKGILGAPPSKEIARLGSSLADVSTSYKHWCEWELLAKQLFLYLVSFTASEGTGPAFVFGAPTDNKGVWQAPMVKSFCDIARSSGINPVDFDQGSLAHPQRATTRLLQNVKLDYLNGWMDERPEGQEGPTTSTLSKTRD